MYVGSVCLSVCDTISSFPPRPRFNQAHVYNLLRCWAGRGENECPENGRFPPVLWSVQSQKALNQDSNRRPGVTKGKRPVPAVSSPQGDMGGIHSHLSSPLPSEPSTSWERSLQGAERAISFFQRKESHLCRVLGLGGAV